MTPNINLDPARMYVDFVEAVALKTKNNKTIGAYIDQLEVGRPLTYETALQTEKARRVAYCGQDWFFGTSHKLKVRDLKSIFYCRNPFCPFCQYLKSQTRQAKFAPELDRLSTIHAMYHFVVTIPNTSAGFLKNTVNKLYKQFPKLLRYLTGNAKIKGLDFSQYGYAGCLRALEITFDKKLRYTKGEYHPHFHCIVALRQDMFFDKIHDHPKFSYDFKNGKREYVRSFSDFEFLLQKIWYLIVNGEKVTKERIDKCTKKEMYSCILDPIDNGYREVFKYVCKAYDEDKEVLQFCQFVALYVTLHNRRTIQGYGCFRNIQPSEDIDMETYHKAFDYIIARLSQLDEFVTEHLRIDELKDEMYIGDYIYLNRKEIFNLDADTVKSLLDCQDDELLAVAQQMSDKSLEKKIAITNYRRDLEFENLGDTAYVAERIDFNRKRAQENEARKWQTNLLGDKVRAPAPQKVFNKDYDDDLPF